MDARALVAATLIVAGLAGPVGGFRAPAGAADAPRSMPPDANGDPAARIRAATSAWPEKSRLLASAIIAEYGVPDEILPAQLVWRQRRPWTMIAVFRDAVSAERPGNLLESVAYEVPVRRWRSLSSFDRGASYDAVRRELVARGESEGTNLLALNLADEVVRGRRTPAEAAAYYDDTLQLSYAGKSSGYMTRLMFTPALRPAAPGSRVLEDGLEREFPLSEGK